jgi:hypothetical protein
VLGKTRLMSYPLPNKCVADEFPKLRQVVRLVKVARFPTAEALTAALSRSTGRGSKRERERSLAPGLCRRVGAGANMASVQARG